MTAHYNWLNSHDLKLLINRTETIFAVFVHLFFLNESPLGSNFMEKYLSPMFI